MGYVGDIPSVKIAEVELHPDLLSTNALNPFKRHNSSSRETMFSSSHIGQRLVVNGSTPRRCQSGVEAEFGKCTFNYKFPHDVEIIKVIPKFRTTMGRDSIPQNSSTLVIFESINTKEVGMVDLHKNSVAVDNMHQHFGFKHVFTKAVDDLHSGAMFRKGTKLYESPDIDKDGNYCYGVETNVAFMSVPGIIEDAMVYSESYAKKITTTGYEKRDISWGKGYYPLNLYGDENNYKPFPDIGDKIRDDGLLFALRTYDDLLGPIEMDPIALTEPDYIFDKLVSGVPNATVTDINIHHDTNSRMAPTPVGMDEQTNKYYQATYRYYYEILEVYSDLASKRRGALKITPEFNRLVVEAMGYVGFVDNPAIKHYNKNSDIFKRRVKKLYRQYSIDDWRVEVSFEYPVIPTVGFKSTDTHGGKGVTCSVWPDDQMPVDIDGNRADVIMDGDSTIKRMNIGRLYEQYINAASRDVTKRIKSNIEGGGSYEDAWEYLMSYYKTVSPKMATMILKSDIAKDYKPHIDTIMKNGIYLWMPTDNPADPVDMIKILRDYFPPTFAPVTYAEGCVTDRPVLIGSIYVILLEKTGGDWTGVSSGKLQHYGILAKITKADKYSTPGRNQPVRILGEDEVRLFNAFVGSDVVADILDQSNSPATHKAIINKILTSDMPTRIDEICDRTKIPLGNSRSLLFVKHILECAGIRFVRTTDDPLREVGSTTNSI